MATRISATSPDQGTNVALIDSVDGVTVVSADGASPKEGLVFITKGSAAAITLATPTAGLPAAGGDDGKVLTIVSTTAFAHTVTTAQNKIADGSTTTKDTLTFAAHAGSCAKLVAYNALWYLLIGSTVAPAVATEV
jgi:hypothetical protein